MACAGRLLNWQRQNEYYDFFDNKGGDQSYQCRKPIWSVLPTSLVGATHQSGRCYPPIRSVLPTNPVSATPQSGQCYPPIWSVWEVTLPWGLPPSLIRSALGNNHICYKKLDKKDQIDNLYIPLTNYFPKDHFYPVFSTLLCKKYRGNITVRNSPTCGRKAFTPLEIWDCKGNISGCPKSPWLKRGYRL